MSKNEITYVNAKMAEKIIETREPLGKFYIEDGDMYVGIDNSNGDAWTEEFKTLEGCQAWLKDEYGEYQFELAKKILKKERYCLVHHKGTGVYSLYDSNGESQVYEGVMDIDEVIEFTQETFGNLETYKSSHKVYVVHLLYRSISENFEITGNNEIVTRDYSQALAKFIEVKKEYAEYQNNDNVCEHNEPNNSEKFYSCYDEDGNGYEVSLHEWDI